MSESAAITDFVDAGSVLAFVVFDYGSDPTITDDHHVQFWKSDGTSDGTVMVADLGVGSTLPTDSGDAHLTAVGGKVFGVISTPATGYELWVSDLDPATPAGTHLVKDIFPGADNSYPDEPNSSYPHDLLAFGGKLYFAADDGQHGTELWVSDGTEEGTQMVKDIMGSPGVGSDPTGLTVGNGEFFFGILNPDADSNPSTPGDSRVELWKSNGTADGTVLVHPFAVGTSPPSGFDGVPQSAGDPQLTYIPETGKLFGVVEFPDGSVRSQDLVCWDVTTETMHHWNRFPGGDDQVGNLSSVFGRLGFAVDDGVHGREPWLTDGDSTNPAGTKMIKDINSIEDGSGIDPFGSGISAFPFLEGSVYFPADDGVNGVELWRSDGTAGGTLQVADILNSSYPDYLTAALGKLFFAALDENLSYNPWVLEPAAPGELDFGDASVPYPTVLASNGARHVIEAGFHLGVTVDVEPDGQPDPHAQGDDNHGSQDDDGVFFVQAFRPGQATQVDVVLTDGSGVGGKLDAWIDWNQDGDWGDAGEQVFTSQSLGLGTNHLSVTTPGGANLGDTAVRFRLSRAGNLQPSGLASNGEVEDHMILTLLGDGEATVMPDFTLTDVNPGSATANQGVSPGDYLQQVSGWYFGAATVGYCSSQFGYLNTLQQDLRNAYPALRIQIMGVNENGQESGNPSATAGRVLPWLQDVDANSDGKSDVFASWQVSLNDIVILNGSNAKVGVYNTTLHDLGNAADLAILRGLLVDAAMASQLPWQNATNPFDVDNQNGVTPLDVLIVINRLNSVGPGKLPPPVTAQLSPPFFDTSGDNEVTALDVLKVINYLNAAASNVAGEGEGALPTTAGPTDLTERIEIAPDGSIFGEAETYGLAPQLHGAPTQAAPAAMADDSWRVGVDLAFATNGLIEPLASSATAPSRAPSDLGYAAARFRLSRGGDLQPSGLASDGDVEEDMILILPDDVYVDAAWSGAR